jgi:hypothetical protein
MGPRRHTAWPISALVAAGLCAAAGAVAAPASVGFGDAASSAGFGDAASSAGLSALELSVDASGDALASWRQGGQSESVVLTAAGELSHATVLPSPDVSKPATLAGLADVAVLRRTPDGRLWALQEVQLGAGSPVELELARWRGAPTSLTLLSDGTRLHGTVSFQGSPVTGFSSTPSGKKLRIYVYLDCFACGGTSGWSPMIGVAPLAGGAFSVDLRPSWKSSRYRATVAGPNLGATLAPAAVTVLEVG